LSWYDAYNKTKHDREDNLNVGTLDNAVKAVGAAVAMFYAQFGFNFGTGFDDQRNSLIRSIFRIVTTDLKKYEKEYYIPNVHGNGGTVPGNWVALDYKF
jgi:predicted HAD superfamily hydrolase